MGSGVTAIVNGTVYSPADAIPGGAVIIEDGRIVAVGARSEMNIPSSATVIDAEGRLVCPGFIDIHVHGGGGADTLDATYEAIDQMARAHVRFGTTALCAATMAAPDQLLFQALAAVADAAERGTGGSRVLGAHIEGPFINPKKRGAHVEEHIAAPSTELMQRFVRAARGHVSVLTIAPELPGALDVIRVARTLGVTCSIGHTDASYEETKKGIEAGATNVTHIYNAMTPLAHREPGVVGAALISDKVFAEVIADGKHVHPAAIDVVVRAKGVRNVLLMTDCMRPAGAESMTSFVLSGMTVYVRDGSCYTADGALCGSLLTMNAATKTMNGLVGVPLHHAINMASLVPARSLGIDDRKGSLERGKDADVVICDHYMNVFRVIVEGETKYQVA